MLEAQWTETGIGLHEVDPGLLKPGYVRLNVTACGICGSDLSRYREPASPLGREVTPVTNS